MTRIFQAEAISKYRGSMTSTARHLLNGALAGTTALNAATFLDMALRKRPASSTPDRTIQRGAELVGLRLPKDDQEPQARASGLGSQLGAFAGVGTGVTLGALRGTTGQPSGTAGTVGAAPGYWQCSPETDR